MLWRCSIIWHVCFVSCAPARRARAASASRTAAWDEAVREAAAEARGTPHATHKEGVQLVESRALLAEAHGRAREVALLRAQVRHAQPAWRVRGVGAALVHDIRAADPSRANENGHACAAAAPRL
jgi:hypothetical protein